MLEWTDSAPFYEMAATDAGRQTFARSCAELLKTYPQFDGVDIDWEHPVIGRLQPGQPATHTTTVLLLAAIRAAIGPGKLLIVAVPASPRGIEPLEYAEMAPLLDWVSVMTYDFHSDGKRAGFNSALCNHDDPSSPKLNLHDAVWIALIYCFRHKIVKRHRERYDVRRRPQHSCLTFTKSPNAQVCPRPRCPGS